MRTWRRKELVGNITRGRFPPPPLQRLPRSCNIRCERRQIRRRLCTTGFECRSECRRKLVHLDLVDVQLRRVDPRMSQQRAKGSDVPAALAEEAIREAVSQLVRRQLADPCPPTY